MTRDKVVSTEEKVVTAVTADGWVLLRDRTDPMETLRRSICTHVKAHGRLPALGEVFRFRCARSVTGQKYCYYCPVVPRSGESRR